MPLNDRHYIHRHVLLEKKKKSVGTSTLFLLKMPKVLKLIIIKKHSRYHIAKPFVKKLYLFYLY